MAVSSSEKDMERLGFTSNKFKVLYIIDQF